MNHELKQTLLQTVLCKYLDLNDLDMLITYSKMVNFAAGDVLLEQGKKSKGTYIIIEGAALVTAKVIGAGSINLVVLDKGNFIGEISLVLKSPSTVSVIANTAMVCLFISSTYFDTLSLFFPQTKFKVSKAVLEDVCFRVTSIYKKITAFMTHSQMVSKSLFGEVMQSLTRAKETNLKDIDIKPQYIQALECFQSLSAEQFEVILANSVFLEAATNCTILKSGEKTPACFIVLRGAVQSSIKFLNKMAKVSVLGPQSLFCCVSYIDGTPSLIDFTTCERTILLKISAENLDALKKDHIDIWYVLYNEICKSFAAIEQGLSKLDIRLNSELYNR